MKSRPLKQLPIDSRSTLSRKYKDAGSMGQGAWGKEQGARSMGTVQTIQPSNHFKSFKHEQSGSMGHGAWGKEQGAWEQFKPSNHFKSFKHEQAGSMGQGAGSMGTVPTIQPSNP